MSLRGHITRNKVTLDTGDVMMTKQSHKAECDIHNILKQYKKTGVINHITNRSALYADLPDVMDYQEAIEMVRTAQDGFGDLPAVVRDRFNNDPFFFLQALGDPSRRAEMVELGLIVAPKPDTTIKPENGAESA